MPVRTSRDGTETANFSYAEAAALVDGTALCFLRDKANLQRGQTILINGASGAVGTTAVQLAKHVIFDVAGKSSFSRCRGALNRPGVYLTTAPSPAILLQMPWTSRFGARKAVVAFTGLRTPGEKRKDLLSIKDLAEASTLVPVIDARYPLPRITDAYRYVDAGHKKGNVVVTLTDPP